SRTTSPAQFKDTNIVLKDGLFDVKESYTLTKKDIKLINDYMKKFHRGEISDDSFYGNVGNYEFANTKSGDINTDNSGYSPIKSKLPFKVSLKMGASGLRVKRLRLALSIILASLSFAIFGLFDTIASYNATNTMVYSFQDSNLNLISIQKGNLSEYDYYNTTFLTNSDLEEVEGKYQGLQFVPIRQYNTSKKLDYFYNQGYDLYDKIQTDNITSYYRPQVLGYSYLQENEATDLGFELVHGSWPLNDNEALITKYIFSLFEEYGYTTDYNTDPLPINSYQDLVGLELFGKSIVGILDTNFNEQRYAPLKTPFNSHYLLASELDYLLKTSAHSIMVLAPGSSGLTSNYFSNEIDYELRAVENSEEYLGMYASYKLVTADAKNVEYFSGKSYENLESELICNSYFTNNLFQMVLNEFDPSLEPIYIPILKDHLLTLSNEYLMGFDEFANRYPFAQFKSLEENTNDFLKFIFDQEIEKSLRWDAFYQVYFYSYFEAIKHQFFKEEYPVEDILSNINFKESRYIEEQFYYNQDQPEDGKLTLDEYIIEVVGEERLYRDFMDYLIGDKNEEYIRVNEIIDRKARFVQYNQLFSEITIHLTAYNRLDQSSDQMNISLAGVIYEDTLSIFGRENPLKKLDVSNQDDFEIIVAAFSSLRNIPIDTLKRLGNEYFGTKSETKIIISNEVLYLLDLFNQSIVSLKNVFLIISIILAAFASLLLLNFIGISVTNKKQEIGILRALGARSKDVFSIFLKEALIIALISFVLATSLTIGAVIYINLFLRREYNILLTFLNFGIRQILVLLLVSTFVATLSSYFPVNKIARLRPIDAIKDRK
ncbi:MAG: ABC transporter permease, partial [Bacilli bacterium]|nr:ABC transporter permease [Bacilli bacterium]